MNFARIITLNYVLWQGKKWNIAVREKIFNNDIMRNGTFARNIIRCL